MYDDSHETIVNNVWSLAHRMLDAAGQSLHVTVLIFDNNRDILAGRSDWAGVSPNPQSRGFLFGQLKAAELILSSLDYEVSATPTGGFLISAGYQGGLRLKVGDLYYVVACSGWDQEADLMFAALLMYAMEHEVAFHHIGFGHGSEISFREALNTDSAYFGPAIHAPASDHDRHYFFVSDADAAYGGHYREHQRGKVVKPGNIHWDVVTGDPTDLLDFIGSFVGGLDLWKYEPNSPEGVVWVPNKGLPFGVMARREWWAVQ